MVYVALIWFAMYFADIPERTRAAVTFFLLPVLLLLVSKHLNEMIVTIVVVSIVVLMIILGVEYAWFSRGIFEVQWSALLVSVLFLAAGVVLHLVGGDYKNGEGIYPLYHSFWHVLAMISLFFILGSRDTFAPPPPKKQKKERKKRRKKREKSAPV